MNEALQYLTEAQLLSFYGWWQFATGLVACLALLFIWWHIGKKQNDLGQVWLALSVLCWSFSGIADIYFSQKINQDRSKSYEQISQLLKENSNTTMGISEIRQTYQESLNAYPRQLFQLNGWRSILSLFNSLLILMALPWFKNIPGRLAGLIKSRYWYYIIGLPFLFSLLPTISKLFFENKLALISELDVYYGILTLFFLGAVLWESFRKRRLPLLAWLTIVVVLFTSIAQLYKLSASDFDLTLLSAIFKTCLIMLFFALALSWVKELAQNIIPGPEIIHLSFIRKKNEKGKFENIVKIKGFPGKENRDILLSPMSYELLLKFAQRKNSGDNQWLEIKPKNETRSGKVYDIKDHNEIRRLIQALLDGLFGKGKWKKEQHFLPLKNCFFEMSEKRERKIRLKIPASNLSF